MRDAVLLPECVRDDGELPAAASASAPPNDGEPPAAAPSVSPNDDDSASGSPNDGEPPISSEIEALLRAEYDDLGDRIADGGQDQDAIYRYEAIEHILADIEAKRNRRVRFRIDPVESVVFV